MEAFVELINPGLFSSVQDLGRKGMQHLGIPEGGAMDKHSYKKANALLHNFANAPVIEVAGNGFSCKLPAQQSFVITGKTGQLWFRGQKFSCDTVIETGTGGVLKIDQSRWSYLAIKGGFKTKKWKGSVCAIPFSKNSVLPTYQLKKGDKLETRESMEWFPEHLWSKRIKDLKSSIKVRIIPGPEFSFFTKKSIRLFLRKEHSLSVQSNRMAYLLNEPIHTYVPPPKPMVSSPVFPGVVQVNHQGIPMVLMRDAQTIGGYPRLGTILPSDLNTFAQIEPNQLFKFDLYPLKDWL